MSERDLIATLPPGLDIYARFYKHAPIDMMEKNLETYGRRPLGFCQTADATYGSPAPLR